jgi:uncharacterized protein YdaU (DUF1376 family)
MTELPYMPLWIGKHHSHTQLLTNGEQHGCYLLLLMAMWANSGWLPNDPRKLAWIAKVPLKRWKQFIAPALEHLFVKVSLQEGDIIQSPQLIEQLQKSRDRRKKNKASADARWLKNKK